MRVTLMYSEECPHWREAEQRLLEVAAEYPQVEVTYYKVTPDAHDQAIDLGYRGSPTLLIDGVDAFPDISPVSCRIYETPDGPAGSPTTAQIHRAIGAALPESG